MILSFNKVDSKDDRFYKIISEQEIKKTHEKVKHFLACVIILSYLVLLILSVWIGIDIPKAYETIALIIIGYYFARYV